jgi:hypothetical protein
MHSLGDIATAQARSASGSITDARIWDSQFAQVVDAVHDLYVQWAF